MMDWWLRPCFTDVSLFLLHVRYERLRIIFTHASMCLEKIDKGSTDLLRHVLRIP
eukprot:m.77027 g.77027  ORF g.77027 m.77027 type:complete len:55 (+) comp11898_c0_seq2:325-489(+)